MSQVNFPVYRIPSGVELKREGTVRYVLREYLLADGLTYKKTVGVLDDTSIPEESLGRRRLVLKAQGVPLLALRHVCYFLADLIRHPSSTYIDSSGKVFQYTKTTNVPLIFKKITKVLPNSSGLGTILEVEGVPTRFKSMISITKSQKYAALLRLPQGYILYGIYSEEHKPTRRKV